MKWLGMPFRALATAKRWDIDFHLPAELIRAFDQAIVKRVDDVATLVRDTRDPSTKSDETFRYVDIASVDVTSGQIAGAQSLLGEEAPSRARKIIRAFDIVVSTVRPTRGAVAVVPEDLHGEIASTGFSIVRANADTNPFYLHFALRLPSTREQFRKWSTGSSYPAILDEDVAKTLIPMPDGDTQDRIAVALMEATRRRDAAVAEAITAWRATEASMIQELGAVPDLGEDSAADEYDAKWSGIPTVVEIRRALEALDSEE